MTRTRSLALAAFCAALSIGAAAFAGETVGPDGEKATPSAELKLSDAEAAKVATMKPTAALLWHTSSDFVNAVTAGAKDEFQRLGVSVVAQTDAGFDSAK
jgi:ribose transport system substrate-binding protein